MALEISTTPAAAKVTRERTCELWVSNRLGEPARIVARREQVVMCGDEVVEWLDQRILVRRDFEAVANETIELVGRPGDPITVGQLWHTIANLLDRWALEDDPSKRPPATP